MSSLSWLSDAISTWTSGGALMTERHCPPLPKGDLEYNVYMGYPENFMWDKRRCVAYVR
jgi:hypothetical protein